MSVFALYSIQVEGGLKRVAKATCGHCNKSQVISNNTQSKSSGYDDDIIERSIASKFERHGWKVGKSTTQHRCPSCFTAIKVTAKRKAGTMDKDKDKDKVVPITPPRTVTREEKRIIFAKIDEVYLDEKTGYSKDWSDKRVAEDLKIPVAWVATLREEHFGPNISEATTQADDEVKALMEELAKVKAVAEEVVALFKSIDEKATRLTRDVQRLQGNGK